MSDEVRKTVERLTDTKIYWDKSSWSEGPWKSEPDEVRWEDASTGLSCVMRRHPSLGYWSGYVDLPSGHPCYGKHYDEIDVKVHGGLTYSDKVEGAWRVGFDCAHAGDKTLVTATMNLPESFLQFMAGGGDVYRDYEYVRQECRDLAKQLVNHE